jgi:hypothetical protein
MTLCQSTHRRAGRTMRADWEGCTVESDDHCDGWTSNMSNAEIEEGIAIFERACEQWPIIAGGGRPAFSLAYLHDQLQTLKVILEERRPLA